MPRYRVYLTDSVTAAFDVEAPTPEAAAEEVREHSTDDGEYIDAETAAIEVCATDKYGSPLVDQTLYLWERKSEEGESDG